MKKIPAFFRIDTCLVVTSLSAGLLLAGCGGSTSVQDAPTPALTMASSTVANGAVAVARNVKPQLTFSAGLDGATATTANVTLMGAGRSVPLSLTVAGTRLTVNPAQQLRPLTAYTLSVGGSLLGASGEKLAGAQSLSFTTGDGNWQTAQLIETNNAGPAIIPQIAIDANGNALAVWSQHDGVQISIWSNRYTAGSGWGTAQLIETDAGLASEPAIAFDAKGNALAVWRQHDGAQNSIWSNRYTAGSGWDTAQLIETNNAGLATSPQIAVDANGNALAVWIQRDATRYDVWSNRYTTGSGWGTAQLIESDNAGSADFPQIAVDANGNAMAVWRQSDGVRTNIWSNRYTAGTGWGTAQLIETDDTGDTLLPKIAIDANGNALAIWSQFDGTRNNIWSNRYTAGTGWGTAQLIETNDIAGADAPQIVFDAKGNALAVWVQSDGVRNNIWSNRYTAGSGWGAAQLIETDNAGSVSLPRIAIDADGNALAVWPQSDGVRNNIWSNRYTVGAGWSTAQLIETDNAGDAAFPAIAIDASGSALVVWQHSDGARNNIWSSRFE
ncbi:Ig-like domain-containing protein [Noviherbaspirillum cavernae]|nr:Ig-like domain-containing protein [Noviherbaspirillum cavernae]